MIWGRLKGRLNVEREARSSVIPSKEIQHSLEVFLVVREDRAVVSRLQVKDIWVVWSTLVFE